MAERPYLVTVRGHNCVLQSDFGPARVGCMATRVVIASSSDVAARRAMLAVKQEIARSLANTDDDAPVFTSETVRPLNLLQRLFPPRPRGFSFVLESQPEDATPNLPV